MNPRNSGNHDSLESVDFGDTYSEEEVNQNIPTEEEAQELREALSFNEEESSY